MKVWSNIYEGFTYLQKRARSTYWTSLISIGLVLYFLGIFAAISLFGNAFARYAEESIVMKIFLYDGLNEDERKQFISELMIQSYVQSLRYVSKEEAGEILLKQTGEDIIQLMDGVNPLLASVNVKLKSDYIDNDSLAVIESRLNERLVVSEVAYPVEMISAVKQNVSVLTFIFVLLSVILVAIVFYIIFATIRLSIYAKRLAIRSMQLIGATQRFIRRPFLWNGLLQGSLAGLFASLGLYVTFEIIQLKMSESGLQQEVSIYGGFIGLLAGIILFGAFLGLVGTFLAVNNYLDKDLDALV